MIQSRATDSAPKIARNAAHGSASVRAFRSSVARSSLEIPPMPPTYPWTASRSGSMPARAKRALP